MKLSLSVGLNILMNHWPLPVSMGEFVWNQEILLRNTQLHIQLFCKNIKSDLESGRSDSKRSQRFF